MSITLRRLLDAPNGLRRWGALLALAIGLAYGFTTPRDPEMGGILNYATATATPLVGAVLGWYFAPRAATPGWRSAVTAVLGFSILAVVLGSFAVAGLSALQSELNPIEALLGSLALGLFGLVLFGLPMLAVALVVVSIWVLVLRLSLRAIGWHPPSTREESHIPNGSTAIGETGHGA